MKLAKTLKEKSERVDFQVSLLTCSLICFSCMIMFVVTFSVMRSILKDTYSHETDLVSGIIASHLDDELYEPGLKESDRSKTLAYLTAMRENMTSADITIYRTDNGSPVYVLDTELEKNGKRVRGLTVEDETKGDLVKLIDGRYFENGGFYKVNGSFRYIKFYPVYDNTKSVKGAVGIAADAGDLYIAEQILRILFFVIILLGCLIAIKFARSVFRSISNPLYQDAMNTDALTGLKNKNSFTVDLHNIERSKTKRYSVISIDLNGLKTINDTLGHQTGDIYIKRAAEVIRKASQNDDAACYRIGGDEFIIILKDKSLKDLEELAKRIDEEIEKNNEGKNGIRLSMSIGSAQFDSEQDRNFSTTIERSDKIMYENKRMYYQKKNMQPR